MMDHEDTPEDESPDTETLPAEEAAPLEAKEMTPEQLAEAEQYGRIDLACSLADRAIDLVYLGCAAFFLARPIDGWLVQYIASDALRVAALMTIVVALHTLVSLPFSYYSSYVVEHRFHLSRQTRMRWLQHYLLGNALAIALAAIAFPAIYWAIWTTGEYWWIAGAALFFFASAVLGKLLPVVIMPMFNEILPLDDEELARRMRRLAEGTGLSIEGVYNIKLSSDTVKAQAMLAGLGSTRRVILGDTLLDNYSHDEIEVVLAHEIGHHVFRHIHKIMVLMAVYSAVGFLVCNWIVGGWAQSVGGELSDVFTAPMLMWIFGIFLMLLEPIQNFISRVFERQCDRYALDRTGMNEAFVAAFQKLAIQNKDDPNPHRLEVVLFHDHPPIADRIAMAKSATTR